jgi:hypothetical protein
MDSSDQIRKAQAKTIFAYYKLNLLSTQATCNYSTCSSLLTTCIVNYPTYAEKQQVSLGKTVCNSCSGSCNC